MIDRQKEMIDMVIDPKQTVVGYRCSACGGGVMSAVNLFNLSADMVKLKCDCKKSDLTVVRTGEGKIRLTVPCILCANPHTYTLSSSLFFSKDLFTLRCPHSDLSIACMGEINQVKAELARSELELLDLMEKNGIDSAELLREGDAAALPDPQILDIVMFVISAVLGAKYYPIPYRWGRLLMIFLLMGAAYGASLLIDKAFFADFSIQTASAGQIASKLGIHTVLILAYLVGAWKLIRKK